MSMILAWRSSHCLEQYFVSCSLQWVLGVDHQFGFSKSGPSSCLSSRYFTEFQCSNAAVWFFPGIKCISKKGLIKLVKGCGDADETFTFLGFKLLKDVNSAFILYLPSILSFSIKG